MSDAFAVALVAQVHAVGVAVAAPAHGDAQAIQPTLELIHVTATRRTSGWRERKRERETERGKEREREVSKQTEGKHTEIIIIH